MPRVLRAAIACLLLVALPLQGYAAGTMLFCGTGGGMPGAVEHAHDHGASHDVQAPHSHDAAAAVAVVADAGAPTLHDVIHGTCSACSSCCSAAALPAAPIAASMAAPRAMVFLDLEHANPGCNVARLERPPRPDLA